MRNEIARDLRDDRDADPDAGDGDGDAEGEAAIAIEPPGDGLRVGDGRLAVPTMAHSTKNRTNSM